MLCNLRSIHFLDFERSEMFAFSSSAGRILVLQDLQGHSISTFPAQCLTFKGQGNLAYLRGENCQLKFSFANFSQMPYSWLRIRSACHNALMIAQRRMHLDRWFHLGCIFPEYVRLVLRLRSGMLLKWLYLSIQVLLKIILPQ